MKIALQIQRVSNYTHILFIRGQQLLFMLLTLIFWGLWP
jgi:hypothetical protein